MKKTLRFSIKHWKLLFVLAAGLVMVVPVLVRNTHPESPSQEWISSRFDLLKEGMSRGEVFQILGKNGDFRRDPNKAFGWKRPLIPFEKRNPNAYSEDIDGGSFDVDFLRLPSHYQEDWKWDNGAIAVGFSSRSGELRKKIVRLTHGRRTLADRAFDPVRCVVYLTVAGPGWAVCVPILVFLMLAYLTYRSRARRSIATPQQQKSPL